MQDKEFTISEELEQMRRQYADLKAQMDRQEITNEKLILSAIRKDLRLVRSKVWLSTVAGFVAMAFIAALSLEFGFRTPFIVISMLWLLSMVVGNIVRNRELSIDSLSGESVRVFLDEIKKRKSVQFRRVRINFCLYVLWIGYFVGECFHSGMEQGILISMLSGLAVGVIIGLALGWRVHNRIIGVYEGIILELENPEAAHTILD